jgi:hypothetical protein
VSRALLSGWISRFGSPQTITTEQGRQFESHLFHSLAKMCGIHLTRTTPHHPSAIGLAERLHRTLKAAIKCHADETWNEALPLVHLGLRTAYKEDLQSSTAELVYGEPLRIPGELLVSAATKVEASTFIQQLRRLMEHLRPIPAARHSFPATFVQRTSGTRATSSCERTPRAAPWNHHTVARTDIARTDKTLQIVVRGRQVPVSTDRVKPAYTMDGTQHVTGSPPAQPSSPPARPDATEPPPARTTRSGRNVHFPARFIT